MAPYTAGLKYATGAHFGSFTPKAVLAYTPVLSAWGAAAFAGIFVFTENWPLFQDTFFKKVPVLGDHWVKEIDPQDVPN
ncbi:unnamed protein product [Ambrosiozyma monospora]|uniref:Unnamed protein product n=1 Tax=Ambrosiozyma monospora TaxID=43982 RepID=A0A9W6YZM9_AMBMO|nr:unnamed protein product [Ambrosiozyma monospora]